ncbi:unnamed protein product [Protopolystoma xenopodis]|uniref:Uncharacterized protein n=1 Tax=Protopolystoma xenopodis TaxID=117903 RepID=A0A448XS72_9PLAT|nr:unnamed protein product [Protopolystoma xenopodis]
MPCRKSRGYQWPRPHFGAGATLFLGHSDSVRENCNSQSPEPTVSVSLPRQTRTRLNADMFRVARMTYFQSPIASSPSVTSLRHITCHSIDAEYQH